MAERRSPRRDRLDRVAAVPAAVGAPDVAQRVDVCGGEAVVDEAEIVDGGAAFAWPGIGAHELLCGAKRPTERHRDAASDQAGCRASLLRRDQIDRALLVVLTPASPVAPLADRRLELLGCRNKAGRDLGCGPTRIVTPRLTPGLTCKSEAGCSQRRGQETSSRRLYGGPRARPSLAGASASGCGYVAASPSGLRGRARSGPRSVRP